MNRKSIHKFWLNIYTLRIRNQCLLILFFLILYNLTIKIKIKNNLIGGSRIILGGICNKKL
jgi:hypothetical protein